MEKVKETMEWYIEEVPNVMQRMINENCEIAKLTDLFLSSNKDSLVIIASGSSYNASICALPLMKKYLGNNVKVYTPYNFLEYCSDELGFKIVISQGGESTNSLDVIRYLKSINEIHAALTSNRESTIAKEAINHFDYGCGIEKIGYVTKGVTTLVLFLSLLSINIGIKKEIIFEKHKKDFYDNIYKVLDIYQQEHENVKKFIKNNYNNLTTMFQSYVLGNNSCYGVALEGALKIGETVCIPSCAYDTEEFLHGPNLQLNPLYTVFIISGHDKTNARIENILNATRSVTDRCFYLGIKGDLKLLSDDKRNMILDIDIPHEMLPFVYLQFFQEIAYKITDDLNRWEKHPTFIKFRENISYKVRK